MDFAIYALSVFVSLIFLYLAIFHIVFTVKGDLGRYCWNLSVEKAPLKFRIISVFFALILLLTIAIVLDVAGFYTLSFVNSKFLIWFPVMFLGVYSIMGLNSVNKQEVYYNGIPVIVATTITLIIAIVTK